VKALPPILFYSVLRLLLFVLPLVALMLLGVTWWIAIIAAALIGLCLSYLFLAKPRNAVALDIHARRSREKPLPNEDDEIEDAASDPAPASAPSSASD
jgi:hypothetical protein